MSACRSEWQWPYTLCESTEVYRTVRVELDRIRANDVLHTHGANIVTRVSEQRAGVAQPHYSVQRRWWVVWGVGE